MKNTFLITTLLATTALATNAVAACTPVTDGNCGYNCTYTINADCHLVIQGPTQEGQTGGMYQRVFYGNTDIISAEIKGNITNIGQDAFNSASNLTSITIGSGVTIIKDGAFANASSLTSIVIPDSVTTIEESAFWGASSLTSVTLPASITTIGGAAFRDTPSLTSMTIPDSLTTIPNAFVFRDTSLTSLVIPDSVTTIEERAFWGATNLSSIVMPDPVPTMSWWTFEGTPAETAIYCQNQACKTAVINASYVGNNFVDYTKGVDGVFTSGGVMYASAEDMQKGASASCGNHDACVAKVQEYKEAKAASMAGGSLCQTKQGCLNLIDMVSNDAYACTTIATCQSMAAGYGVNLAAADPAPAIVNPGGNGGSGTGTGGGSSTGSGKRIYTVEEARQAVEAAGTETVNFRIRYK